MENAEIGQTYRVMEDIPLKNHEVIKRGEKFVVATKLDKAFVDKNPTYFFKPSLKTIITKHLPSGIIKRYPATASNVKNCENLSRDYLVEIV